MVWLGVFVQCARSSDSIDESLNDVTSLGNNQPYVSAAASSDVAELMGHGQQPSNMHGHSHQPLPPSLQQQQQQHQQSSSLPPPSNTTQQSQPPTNVDNNNDGLMEITMASMHQHQPQPHHHQQNHQHNHHHHNIHQQQHHTHEQQSHQLQQHQNHLNSITMNTKPDWGLTAL